MNSGSLLASQPLGQQESSPHGKKVESDKDEDVLLASACVVMGVYTSRLYAHIIHHTYIHRIITHNSLCKGSWHCVWWVCCGGCRLAERSWNLVQAVLGDHGSGSLG